MCKRSHGKVRDPRAAHSGDGPGRADCRLRSLTFPCDRPQFSIAHAHSALTGGAPKPWDLSPPSSSHRGVCRPRPRGGPQPGDHAHATLRSRGPRSARGRPSPLQPHTPPGSRSSPTQKNCAPQPAPGGVVHTQGHSTSRQPPPPARSARPCTRRTSLHLATRPLARCTSALLAYATAHAGLCGTQKQPSAVAACFSPSARSAQRACTPQRASHGHEPRSPFPHPPPPAPRSQAKHPPSSC